MSEFDLNAGSSYGSPAPHSETLISTGRYRAPLNASTRGWATSAIVLGVLFFLFESGLLAHAIFWPSHRDFDLARAIGSTASVAFGLSQLCILVLPVFFIAAGVGVLHRLDFGRRALVAIAAFATVPVVVNYAAMIRLLSSPLFLASIAFPRHSDMSTAQFHSVEHITVLVMILMGAVCILVQIVYCVSLSCHMNGQQARLDMQRP